MNEALSPGAFTKALQDKRAAERRRKWWIGGGLTAAALLIALAVYLLYFSQVFAAMRVEVDGTQLLTSDEVVTAAEVALGEPLLLQDKDAIRQRVSDLAPVKSADVSLGFPDAVVIQVTEREAAYLRERAGQYDWVDDEGVTFHHTPETVAGQLLATVAEDDQRLLADVATVAAAVPADLRGHVVSIQAEAVDRISLSLDEGRTVVWGSAEESSLKAEVIGALLTVEATVYDVSAPGHPTTR